MIDIYSTNMLVTWKLRSIVYIRVIDQWNDEKVYKSVQCNLTNRERLENDMRTLNKIGVVKHLIIMFNQERRIIMTVNRYHHVGTRLNDIEYRRFRDIQERSSLKGSEVIRNFICYGKVDVRYDGDIVERKMCQIQDRMNQMAHAVREDLHLINTRIDYLERSYKTGAITQKDFSMNLGQLRYDAQDIDAQFRRQKEGLDKELIDCVNF